MTLSDPAHYDSRADSEMHLVMSSIMSPLPTNHEHPVRLDGL